MISENWQLRIGNWKPSATAAVIFDMDGVIVDSEPYHERAFRDIFGQMGYGESHGMRFADYYGKSDVALWRDFVARHAPPQPLEELIAWKQRHFLELLKADAPIFDGLPELVLQLGARFKLAVASGSQHAVIDEVLAMQDLRRHFAAVVSVQDVPRGKPAPDVFLCAADQLGLPPRSCCVIEDSVAGVQGARAAGMAVIAITTSFGADALRDAGADHVVERHEEVSRLLLPQV